MSPRFRSSANTPAIIRSAVVSVSAYFNSGDAFPLALRNFRNISGTCAVSKEYEDPKGAGYWFAFHPHQLEKLKAANRGYAAFGCGSPDSIALLPVKYLEEQLDGMNETHLDDRSYWHVQIHREGKRWVLHRRKGQEWPEISSMMVLREP